MASLLVLLVVVRSRAPRKNRRVGRHLVTLRARVRVGLAHPARPPLKRVPGPVRLVPLANAVVFLALARRGPFYKSK